MSGPGQANNGPRRLKPARPWEGSTKSQKKEECGETEWEMGEGETNQQAFLHSIASLKRKRELSSGKAMVKVRMNIVS